MYEYIYIILSLLVSYYFIIIIFSYFIYFISVPVSLSGAQSPSYKMPRIENIKICHKNLIFNNVLNLRLKNDSFINICFILRIYFIDSIFLLYI